MLITAEQIDEILKNEQNYINGFISDLSTKSEGLSKQQEYHLRMGFRTHATCLRMGLGVPKTLVAKFPELTHNNVGI